MYKHLLGLMLAAFGCTYMGPWCCVQVRLTPKIYTHTSKCLYVRQLCVLEWVCEQCGGKCAACLRELIDPQLQVAELETIAQHVQTCPDY